MEWGAYASSCRSSGAHEFIDCDAARRSGKHEPEETCGDRSEFVIARLGGNGEEIEDKARAILTVREVLEHLSDTHHDWHGLSHLDRLGQMGLCISGICNSPYLPGTGAAWNLIALEGLGEEFGGLPARGGWLDQPYGYVQAYSVIRSTRNQIQDRNIKAAKDNSRSE